MAAIEMPITEHIRSNTSKRGRIRMAIHDWTADLLTPVKSARLLASGQTVKFQQEKLRTKLLGLPREAPDTPLTTIAIECDGEPKQDNILVRNQHERLNA